MIETGMRTPPADASLAVTEQYTEAYNLNVKIHTSMQAIQQNLYDMCSALKKRPVPAEHLSFIAKLRTVPSVSTLMPLTS